MSRSLVRAVALAAVLSGCSSLHSFEDAGSPDAAVDAGADAGFDAGEGDAGVDGGGVDAGRCGGAACPVQTLAAQRILPLDVGVNSTHVLWLEFGGQNQGLEGQLNRIAKGTTCLTYDGGCVEDLNTQLLGRFLLASLAVRDDAFCWLEFYANMRELRCQSLTSGTERLIHSGLPYASDLRFDGDQLLFVLPGSTTTPNGQVIAAQFAGTSTTPLLQIAGSRPLPTSVTADAERFYWAEAGLDGGGAVWAQPRDGGLLISLASAEQEPASLAVYGGQLYWIDTPTGLVRRAPANGVGPAVSVATGQQQPVIVRVDESGIYWLNWGTGPNHLDGELKRVALDGGAPRLLAGGLREIYGLALDSDSVTWTEQGTNAANYLDGTVRAVFKP